MTTNLRVRTVPRLCELNPDICLTTEERARKNLSEGVRPKKFVVIIQMCMQETSTIVFTKIHLILLKVTVDCFIRV